MKSAASLRRSEIQTFDLENPYGRASIPDLATSVTNSRLRRWTKSRNNLFHRPKNGIYDPVTMFHLVDALVNIRGWQPFTAATFVGYLNQHKPMLCWDAVTVGRILGDLVESWNDAHSHVLFRPLVPQRLSRGREYQLTNYVEGRRVMFDLLDDLARLADDAIALELVGKPASRSSSPLGSCPSLTAERAA